MGTQILLVHELRAIRERVRKFLKKQVDMEVIEEVQDPVAAVRLSEKLRPDIVLMGMRMRDSNGIEATRRIVSRAKDIKVIVFSMRFEKKFVAEMLKAGVSACLSEDSGFVELLDAIRAVRNGHVYLSRHVLTALVADYLHRCSRPAAS